MTVAAPNPGLHNAPGPWRWEQRGDKWWRVNDAMNIEDGPHVVRRERVKSVPSDNAPVGRQELIVPLPVWPKGSR